VVKHLLRKEVTLFFERGDDHEHIFLDREPRKGKPTMDCETVISIAFQMSGLIVTIIFGLLGLVIALIKLSQKEK